MLTYVEGDIFRSPAQVLVNTVNTVGVMGKGIALSFKKRYPEMFETYKKACESHKLQIGNLLLYYGPDHWILNFPTKENWRNPSKMEYIEKGLKKFVQKYAEYNIVSAAFPRLGCGNGDLDWNEVRPLMEKYLKDLPIEIYVYLGPGNNAESDNKKQKIIKNWQMKNARDMAFRCVQEEIAYQSAVVPISFSYQNEDWEARWNKERNSLILHHGSEDIELNEEDFQRIWDHVQTYEIFTASKKKEQDLLYELLKKMGYLTEVKIQDEDTSDMVDGYQLDAGAGHYYLVKGESIAS